MANEKEGEEAGPDAAAPGYEPTANSPGTTDVLDYSKEDTSETKVSTPEVGKDYDPRPQEDGARRTIAYLLIGLLWLVTVAIFLLLGFGSLVVTDIKEFAVLLGPIVTLVSAATGFYYGTKTSSTTT
jgi:hypothetical protein